MNHLIAKIKLRGNAPKYKKVFSGETLFDLPSSLITHVEYNPDHRLDEDSWFGISNFSSKEYCLSFLRQAFNSAEYDSLNVIDVDKLDFICSYQNGNEYYFQRVTKTQLVSKKLLHLGDSFSFEESSKIIVINNNADAIYLKSNDSLYFKNLSAITGIFKGIDELYREATEAETIAFLESDFIHLNADFSAEKVKKPNRQRIAMAVDTLNSFEEEEKEAVFSYIKDYCPELELHGETFVIQSEDDLKMLLYGIEQRYYTTPIKGERRLANSIVALGA